MAVAMLALARPNLLSANDVAVLALPFGLAGTLLAVVLSRLKAAPRTQEWADRLATQVSKLEEQQLRQLTGDFRHRIDLLFRVCPVPGLGATTPTDHGRPEGIGDITGFWRGMDPQRLVITGAPGAGKTVLALNLVLGLLKNREPNDAVPVRISMAGWDTEGKVNEQLARHLEESYGFTARMAGKLVAQKLVLPVLDGLDEMDRRDDPAPSPDTQPVHRDLPRALIVLTSLNNWGRDLVITCRTNAYDDLAATHHIRLVDAARIEVQPVGAGQAADYLDDRSAEPARWEQVLAALRNDSNPRLAEALSTPWLLCLAATVYSERHLNNPALRASDNRDPAELLLPSTPRDLSDHLLGQFIGASVARHPGLPRRNDARLSEDEDGHEPADPKPPMYGGDDVHTWLAHLAAHLRSADMQPPSATGPGSTTDLVLSRLWPLAGERRVRIMDGIVTGLIVLTTLPLAWTTSAPVLAVVTVSGIAVAAGTRASVRRVHPPKRMDWYRAFTPSGLRRFRVALKDGLAGALIGAAGGGLIGALLAHSASGGALGSATGGVMFGLASGLESEPSRATSPRGAIRSDLAVALSGGAALAAGAVTGVAAGFWGQIGFVAAMAAGVGGVLSMGVESGRRYLVFVLCMRGELPLRLGLFLDWALSAGLLRLAGAAYQFRHEGLQEWLERHPGPSSS
ncbi:NACHT domain-containing protein [Streptomyces spectabilis]|nr:NACHT domain-containing protein [Streptomyces spectabilis]